MLTGSSTVGTVTHDGVQTSSNYQTDDAIRSTLGIEAPDAPDVEPSESVEAPPAAEAPKADAAPAEADTPTEKPQTAKDKKRDRYDTLKWEAEEAKREAARIKQDSERQIAARERQVREEYERRIADLQQQYPPERPQPKTEQTDADPEPKLEQFADQADPYAAWMRATAKWDARNEFRAQQQAAQEAEQKAQAERSQFERQQKERERLGTFHSRMHAAFERNPDLRALVESGRVPDMTRPMLDVVIESEIPDQIAQYFAEHPEEASKIRALPALHQFRAVSRIEYQLEAAAATGSADPAKPKTTAHPPVSPVSGAHAAPKTGEPDPNTCTQEEWDTYWNAREREAKAARR